jgi:hypothetical protein
VVEFLPQGSATYVAENNSWKLIVWPNPGRGWFRSVSGPLLPVLLAASATGGSISLELSLDTNKLWKRSFGDTLETHWGLRYPLASQQREKFNTPHTKIASESVQCHVRFSQKIEKLNFFTCVPGSVFMILFIGC